MHDEFLRSLEPTVSFLLGERAHICRSSAMSLEILPSVRRRSSKLKAVCSEYWYVEGSDDINVIYVVIDFE